MSSASPGWAETSVRWLRTNRPEFVIGSTAKPFDQLLDLALWRMKFIRREKMDQEGWGKEIWRSRLTEMSRSWVEANHRSMVRFLDEGGYHAPETEKVVIDHGGIIETLELEMDELDEVVEQKVSPPSQLSPDHELREIIEAEQLKADPRQGVW
jgi:hypothetical protein